MIQGVERSVELRLGGMKSVECGGFGASRYPRPTATILSAASWAWYALVRSAAYAARICSRLVEAFRRKQGGADRCNRGDRGDEAEAPAAARLTNRGPVSIIRQRIIRIVTASPIGGVPCGHSILNGPTFAEQWTPSATVTSASVFDLDRHRRMPRQEWCPLQVGRSCRSSAAGLYEILAVLDRTGDSFDGEPSVGAVQKTGDVPELQGWPGVVPVRAARIGATLE